MHPQGGQGAHNQRACSYTPRGVKKHFPSKGTYVAFTVFSCMRTPQCAGIQQHDLNSETTTCPLQGLLLWRALNFVEFPRLPSFRQ